MPTQRPVLLQRCPAPAAGGIALVVAFPGELHAQAPVAAVIAKVLDAPNTIGVTFEVFSGDRLVAEAVRSL